MSVTNVKDILDKQFSIQITYLPANETISFSGFFTKFTDSLKQEWTPESVYGRMDPMHFYKGTTRAISIDFDVPAESFDAAQVNFRKLSRLMRFAYPVYEKAKELKLDVGTATAGNGSVIDAAVKASLSTAVPAAGNALLLSSPPLIAMKFANFISSGNSSGKLIGKFQQIQFDADDKSNYFAFNGGLYPSTYKLSLNLDVIHSSPLGWERDENDKVTQRNKKFRFPYGV